MNNWPQENRNILDYRIVRGLPAEVENEVKMLLETGWQPSGELQKIKFDGTDIVVQCMVLYNAPLLC